MSQMKNTFDGQHHKASTPSRPSDASTFPNQYSNQPLQLATIEQEPADDRLLKDDFFEVFSLRRPKHMGAGLVSGIKSVGKGVALGATAFFMAPFVGATTEGVSGFVKGLATGTLGAVALPLTSVGVAGVQITRGICNTYEAVMESSNGRKWDKNTRTWKDNYYNLEDDAKETLGEKTASADALKSEAGPSSAADKPSPQHTYKDDRPKRKVKDTRLYDILEVEPNAPVSEIKKQYYKLARRCHPDKCPDDPEANIKFQNLGEAYQVLQNETTRERYDETGDSSSADSPILDSGLLFMMLFGSEKFEPYIGKLKVAAKIELLMDPAKKDLTEESIEEDERRRHVILAINLRDLIEPYVKDENVDLWLVRMRNEAEELSKTSYGIPILETVGWAYSNYAHQYLGKQETFLGIGGRYAKMQAKTRGVSTGIKTTTSVYRTAMAARHLHYSEAKLKKNQAKKKGNTGDHACHDDEEDETEFSTERMKNYEETVSCFLDTVLNLCLLDIGTAVRSASKKVLKDMSVEQAERNKRANALITLGNIFQEVAKEMSTQVKQQDALHSLQEAFIKVQQQKNDDFTNST